MKVAGIKARDDTEGLIFRRDSNSILFIYREEGLHEVKRTNA
jgi:hypothetical protein